MTPMLFYKPVPYDQIFVDKLTSNNFSRKDLYYILEHDCMGLFIQLALANH